MLERGGTAKSPPRLGAVVPFWPALLAAFGLVFVAEFADKTQLVLLTLSARGKGFQVWFGAAAAFLLLTAAAAAAGDLLSRYVPDWVVTVLAGLLFLGFGLLGLRDEDEEAAKVTRTGFAPAFTLILVAELGDKTQIAVAALAAESGAFWATAIGGTTALWATSALAVLAGGWISTKVDPERMERIAAWLFIVLGVFFLASLLWR